MITDRNYFFFQAYELLGRRLFGGTWTGYEIQETEMESPEEIEVLRMPVEAEIRELDDQDVILEAERARITPEAEMEENLAEAKDLRQTRATHLAALLKLPEVDERYRDRYQSLERRKRAEEQLIDALSSGALSAMYGIGLMVPKDLWAGTPGFKYFLDLSIAVMPSTRSGLRRGPLFIPKDAFDEWVGGIIPEVMDDSIEVTPRMLCEIFLREVSAGPKSKSKTGYRKEAMSEIEGLSVRQFNSAWDQEISNHWKKPGRPPGSKKS